MPDRISVIVPIYNSEKYLKKCVDSILQQTYKNIEIILVDDGSSDESAFICDDYKSKNGCVKVLHKPNEGLIKARIDGVSLATGQWIAFVDSDDWIDENMYSSLMELGTRNSVDIVISAAKLVFEERVEYRTNLAKEGLYIGKKLEYLKNRLLDKEEYFQFMILPYIWNKLWRRELLLNGFRSINPDITIGEDVAIGIPTILGAQKIVLTNEAYYNYRQNMASMTNQNKDQLKEYRNAGRLYSNLRNSVLDVGYKYLADNGLKRYYINQVLTRSYEIVNQVMSCRGVFGFSEVIDKPINVFGAGAFGCAVFDYVENHFGVKFWIDSNAEFLRTIGYPVVSPEEIEVNRSDIFLVAVVKHATAQLIRKDLIEKGVDKKNVLVLDISVEQERRIIEYQNRDTHLSCSTEKVFPRIV